jgi:RHS repeat-associated protein
MNSKPVNNTLSPGVYCGGLTIGNTNGATFTMSPGTYIMAGGGFTINSLGIVSGSGVTVYNTSSTGWGCSANSSYTPITISGQANLTLTAPSSGAQAGVIFFGDRAGCSTLGSCQDQINSGSITKLNGAMYFKSDTLVISGTASNTGCMTVAADKININGNSPFAITGCTGTVGAVTVSVSPTTASLYAGQTQQFSATVTNAASTAVTWSVSGGGTINSSGLYTAPASVTSQQTVTITAISQAEPTVSASATVTLLPPVSVSVAPPTATLYAAHTQQFSVTVANASNTAVNWAISPAGIGTVSSSGLYTAPASITSQQTVTITATSQADSTKSATATVTLMPAVAVSVTPTTATLNAGQTQQFSASVVNTNNTAVSWSISPTGSGSVSSSGLYTAPTSLTKQQTVTVTATSQADSTKSASAPVTVNVPAPVILSITPGTALPSTQITIAGQNFLTAPGSVMLNGVSLPTTSWSNMSISLLVPTNNCTGPVVVNTQYGTSNAVTLTIEGTQVGCLYPVPMANAGSAQTVTIGANVQLDGTGSTDQTGNPLTYSWSFVSIPSGSAAVLSNTTLPKPTFVADVYGSYTLQLIVNDGYHNSVPSQVVISTKDSAPVANAGQNQTVPTQTLVQLNGSASSDVDGNTLTYLWSFVSLPANSRTVLMNATSVNPTFTTDKKGTYTVQLIVNDGQLNSAPATVTIGDVNTPPVANAGPNQSVQIGATVQLNGSGSTDVDGDPLTYRWSILSAPAGSSATLSSTSIVNPTFVADVPGNFVAQLIVNDGTVDSAPVTVTIGNQDIAPVAIAGAGQTVAVGALVSLDGTASTDSDNKLLTYSWSILSAPTGSLATLTSATAPNPAFTADKYGNYVVQLIVNDGYLNSSPTTVTISTIYTSPVANPGPAQSVATSATVNLTGAASTSNDGYSLTYKWSMLSTPAGSAAALTNSTTVTPSFVADVAGAYVVQLIVNDTVSDSVPKTVMITAIAPNQAPVVNAGPDQTVYFPTLVTLAGTATDDGLPLGSTLSVQWSMLSGPGTAMFVNPGVAATSVTFDQPGTYVLQFSANDTQYTTTGTCKVTYLTAPKQAPVVSAGANQTVPIPNNLPLQGSVTSSNIPPGAPTAQWSVLSTTPAGLTATFANATSPKTTISLPQAGTYVLQLTGTESGLSASSTVTIIGQTAATPPSVNAGPSQEIELPTNSVTLSGTATDPSNGTLTYAWTQVAGPAGAIQSSATASTAVTFSMAGSYTFRLTATSSTSSLSGSATVHVTVSQANQPPIVNAGNNQTVTLPITTVQLNGSATDDGLPSGVLNTAWTVVSAPNLVAFANAKSLATSVTFGGTGTYVLQLSANDTQYTTASNVTITVLAPNQPPVVSASDIVATINTPAQLNGSVTENGLPLGGHLTSMWSVLSGPGTVVFVDASSPVTSVTFSAVGTYVLRLSASDGQLSTSTTITALVGDVQCVTSNNGTDYWLMFPTPFTFAGAELFITGQSNANATVTIPGLGWSQSVSIVPGQVTTVSLPAAVYAASTDGVESKGIHVTGTAPIVVYGFHAVQAESDGFLGLPTDAMGTDYLVVSYPNPNPNSYQNSTEFGVVAPYDNTTLTITPSQTAGTRTAGIPYTVMLNQGQTYQLLDSVVGVDLTGSEIQSDKPVAVMGASSCGDVPVGASYCNYLIEQMVPINSWGQVFGTVPLANRLRGDTFRVLASQDGTQVSINGTLSATLARGNFFDAQLTNANSITSTAPIAVMQYSDGETYDGQSADPMMMLVPPFEEYGGNYTFTTATDSWWQQHFVNVVVPAAAQGTVLLDGTAVDSSSFAAIPGSQFVGAQVQLSQGTHSISASLPFDIQMYGWAPYDGYGYAGGVCLSHAPTMFNIALSPTNASQNIGNQQCIGAQVTDLTGNAVGAVGVQFSVSGSNSTMGYAQTNASGSAQFCYTGTTAGADLVTASAGTSSAQASIQWISPDSSPVVSITQPTGVQLSVPFLLAGSVSYGGGGTLSFVWDQPSGPAAATFQRSNSIQTTAVVSVPGTYVFRLTTSDGIHSGAAVVTILVLPNNQPPQVSAGTAQSVVLPNPATLVGLVTDDGLPLGAPLTQWWSVSQVSGWKPYNFGSSITINHAQVANSDQVDFPFLISGVYPYLANVKYGGNVNSSNGWDILFTSDAAGQNKLDHEIDNYDPTTGSASFWVRIPRLSHTTDTIIYMWFGNSAISSSQENKPGVWRNGYAGVWHLPSGGVGTSDSTGNSADGAAVSAYSVSGKIGSADNVSGGWIDIPSSAAYKPASALTLEAWVNPTGNYYSWSWDKVIALDYRADGSWNAPYLSYALQRAGNSQNFALQVTSAGTMYLAQSAATMLQNSWSHIVGTFDSKTQLLQLYMNGQPDPNTASGPSGPIDYATSQDLTFGSRSPSSPGDFWNGSFDEVRISSVARSADWIATEYNNQSSPTSFYSLAEFSNEPAVTFSNPTSPATQVTFTKPGTYILQLSASDTQYTTTSQVTVTALPAQSPNQPPVVSAGADQTITLPSQAALNGSVKDDGLPAGAPLTIQWSVVSGPGPVVFANPSQPKTTANFSQAGTYVLSLGGNDTQYTTSSMVTIVVNAAVTTQNQPPVVTASPTVPAIVGVPVALNGTATDDGLPNGTLTVEWSVLSGPGAVAFANASAAASTATFSSIGTYVLQLSACDSQYTSTLPVTVTVSHQPPTVSAGSNQVITLPAAAILVGTVSDEGLPTGVPVTVTWTQVTSPTVDAGNGYLARRMIVINHNLVPNTDQQDFPILISGTYSFLATVGNGGGVLNPKGWDIIFTSDLAGQNKLDHEIDSYDPTTGTASFWVRVPLLSHTTDTQIYLWYGNADVAVSPENKTGVWKNNYLSVYHFGNVVPAIDPVGTADSGVAGYTLSGNASPAAGIIGGGVAVQQNSYESDPASGSYAYLDYFLDHSPVPLYPTNGNPVTLETWAKFANDSGVELLGYGSGENRVGLYYGYIAQNSGNYVTMDLGNYQLVGAYQQGQLQGWHHIVGAFGGNNLSPQNTFVYLDGQLIASGSASANPTTADLEIGGYPGAGLGGANGFTGSLDEVRISSGTRSTDWVATEYNNQSSPSRFYSIGSDTIGTVTFSDPTSLATQATFSAPGMYLLQLTANDTKYTVSSTVTVVVNPAVTQNQPPVVSAGADQTITMPNEAVLRGSVTDDGLPAGAPLTSQWSMLSGSGTVLFANPNRPSTAVTFSQAGTYVLSLSGNDTQYTTTSTVTVVVNSAVITQNQPPVVTANPAVPAIIGTPLALNGTATDDGLPNGTLSVQWSVLSGPGTVTFSNASSAASTATFSAVGTYALQLSANDSQYTSTVPVTIAVSHPPPVVSAGASQVVTLPSAATLSGSVSEVGLPPGTPLTTIWSVLDAPEYSRPFVIDHNKVVNTDQSDFPVLISGVYPFLATVANGGLVQNPNGWDIFFTSDAAGQNKLDHEIDTYDPITGTASFWVRIPLLSHITDTVIYMCFGNNAISSSQENKPGVWRNGYAAVWHLGNGAAVSGADSTGVNNGTVMGRLQGASGMIGGGASNSAQSGQYISVPDNPVLDFTTGDEISVSAWAKRNNTNGLWEVFFTKSSGPSERNSNFGFTAQNELQDYWTCAICWFGLWDGYQSVSSYTDYENWHYYAFTDTYGNGATAAMYVDGVGVPGNWASLSGNNAPPANTSPLTLGGNPVENTDWFNGIFDEVRISKGTIRTADWIATEYNNQSSPSTFYNIGSNATAVTFSDPTSPVTQATFSQPGTYLLQLTANDTVYTVTSTVAVVANPEITTQNQPPVVTANPTLPAFAGTPVALTGTATDDGLPNGTLTVQWSILSGPGTVTFSNASSAASTAIFSVVGTYVLQLSANDSQYTSAIPVTIVVSSGAASGGTAQPPTVNAGAPQYITLPTNSVTLSGLVSDTNVPASQLSISWAMLSGPATVSFSNPNAATTLATFSSVGVYLLQLTVSDGTYTSNSITTVVVNPAGGSQLTDQPPTLQVSAPGTVILPNNTATLAANAAADPQISGNTLTLLWSQTNGPAAATIASPAQANTVVTFLQVGNYTFQLVATDAQGLSTTATLNITVEAQPGTIPTVQISSPSNGTGITAPTVVSGSVSSGAWTLAYAPLTASGTGTYQVFASGSGSASGTLGTLDPTNMLNGNYSILLSTVDQWGQTANTSTAVSVSGNLKLGAFSIAFQDLSVPLPGLPIIVTRTYDSRDRSQGDFGDGWRLSIANVRVQKNGGPLGQTWDEEMSFSGYFPTYCLQTAKNHSVTATFPDGRVYKFTPTVAQSCQYFAIQNTNLTFNQVSTGSNTAGATLSVLDGGNVVVSGSQGPVDLFDYNGNYYDSTQFKLTTADGYIYYLDMTLGVTKLVDPNGNTLTINASGVVSSAGPSVAFSRDGQGRISSIADPTGALVSYQYSSAGDLQSVTDRAQNTTTFGYDNNHYLTTIKDPRGVSAVKNTYDDSGRLVSTTDANGNTIKYTPNMAANQEQIADQLGNITLYTYDNDGNITQKTDPLGNVTSYTYDANDNQLSQSVYLGSRALTTSYTYDGVGNKLTETDPLGNTTTYSYNSLKQVLTVTDALKRTTTNVYDGSGNLTSTTDPNGKLTSYSYNGNGTVASVTDALNNTTSFSYDGQGNLTSQVDALGNTSSYTYDANNNKLSQTVTRTLSNGTTQKLTTSYEYDGNNRLTKTHLPDGAYTEVHYNNIGKQDQTWDAKRNQTSYTYDNTGRLTSTAYADGTTDTTGYDADGHRTSYTDRGGHTTSYTYDAAGRMTTTTYPDNSTSATVYDSASRVSSTVDRNGNSTSYAYDDAGRRTGVTDALNHTTSFVYDNAGQQLSVTDARNNTVQYAYDADGRQTRTTYPDQSFSLTGYDALGRMTSKTDQASVVTGYGYDNLGRLTSVTQDVGGLNLVTNYGYDELGNRVAQTDAAKRTTKYAYDQLGRRSQRTLPLGQAESYGYEANGNLSSKTDFNGKTTTYSYDPTNRLLTKTPDASFNASPVTLTYTATGKRQTMTDPSGTTTYSYDPQTDRLMSKQTPYGTISYTYDAAGDVTDISSSNQNGAAMAYQYDKLNRLSSVIVAGQSPTVYGYDDVGNLAGYTYPNGVTTALQYDPLNRLTSLASQGPQGAAASYSYTLGAAGNRTGVTELGGRTVSYGYDNLYRLTSETIANSTFNGTVGYTYDAVGNRKQITSTLAAIPSSGLLNYDANDRTLTDQYDNNGNTISQAGIADSYDFENHLTQHGYIVYQYDGDGNRVAKTIGGVTTSYLVDTLNPTGYAQVLDEVQSGAVTRSYAWGLQLVSETQLVAATPPANPWVTSWYGFDGHGSVRYLTSSTGAVTDAYAYDAFGNLINSSVSTANNYLFAGEQFDPNLNLYYNRARYLDVRSGRFWGMDTHGGNVRHPLSRHRYLYASANPVNRRDRSGHDDMAEISVSVGISEDLDAGAASEIMQVGEQGINLAEEAQTEFDVIAEDVNDAAAEIEPEESVESATSEQGDWESANESMSARAQNYQVQVGGRAGEVYSQNGVAFDGFNGTNLIEAKGPGYANFVSSNGTFYGWFNGAQSLAAQAARQIAASAGRNIIWYVAEAKAAQAIVTLLEDVPNSGIINVVFQAPIQ